jgi:hypothetical protein
MRDGILTAGPTDMWLPLFKRYVDRLFEIDNDVEAFIKRQNTILGGGGMIDSIRHFRLM